jgi:membrane-associated phospholipid phosphatase
MNILKKINTTFISIFLILGLLPYNNIYAKIEEIQSPYKTHLGAEVLIYTIGILNGIGASVPDVRLSELTTEEINKLNKSDIFFIDRFAADNYSKDFAMASDILIGTALVYPAVYFIDDNLRDDFTAISVMYTQTLLFSGLMPSWGKGLSARIRPFVYNPNAPIEEKFSAESRRSFFSGHTTVAFSTMAFLSKVYSDYYPKSEYLPYIWGSSLLLASSVGISRIAAGAHFPTDVIVGAVVGSAIGYIIPELHKIKTDNYSLIILPNQVGLIVKL